MLSLSILTAGYSRPSSPEKRGEEQGRGRGRGGEGEGGRGREGNIFSISQHFLT